MSTGGAFLLLTGAVGVTVCEPYGVAYDLL